MSFDVDKVRADFPILSRQVNGKPLVYLDSGASAQKPQVVIDAIAQAYGAEYANVHRGLHFLSNLATDNYERVRATIARFLNAPESGVIFTSGTTEGINLVSYAWAAPMMQPGDEIVLSVLEHHANIVPWNFLRERQGVVLKWIEPEPDGSLPAEKVLEAVGPKTKLIAVTHMSNVTGTVVDVGAIARGTDVPVLADGSQAAVHMPVDVASLGVAFYPITGHKLYGPSGSGAIWIDPKRQAEMRPFMGGGDMIKDVTRDFVTYAEPPLKFEAGTPGIVNQIGLGVALDYLTGLGMENVAAHERSIRDYARDRLRSLNWLEVQGDAPDKGAIFSMTMEGAHAHDLSTILDKRGIAIRAGTHCAMPLMEFYGKTATARASFAMYNTKAEVDALISGLEFCRELFG
ncbi:MAG: cysteine desulfurase [Paracoccus denitrificans]|nr:MAG: cysteine desulfurase [Paracoccus denitrificans]PZO83721.1 MAG: cysteine desulfurase [Paracoccus denitrificans]